MRSGRADSRPRSLVRRMVWLSAGAAALGGLASSLASAGAAGGLFAAHRDAVMRSAAERLAEETFEELHETLEEARIGAINTDGDDDESIAVRRKRAEARPEISWVYELSLLDELEDVDLPNARARIDGARGLLAGDARLPRSPAGDCENFSTSSGSFRACTVVLEDGITLTLASSTRDAEARLQLLLWSALIGCVVAACFGAILSRAAASWALSPLHALEQRVRSVDAHDPKPDLLEPPLAHQELEAVRGSVAELVESLRDALSSARRFASHAAHELRTPLTTIAGQLELLSERSDADPSLESVRRQVHELVELVQRLLILAQRNSLLRGDAETVDLADVLESVRERLPPVLHARLHAEAGEDVLVRGDASLLRAMLSNAIDNALKFSSDSVEVRVHVQGERASIGVVDRGPGIPEGERERVFDAFYRTPEARAGGAFGQGLGLALIAHVAEVHGGTAHIEETGAGTHLRIDLPLWAARSRP